MCYFTNNTFLGTAQVQGQGDAEVQGQGATQVKGQ